MTVFNINQSYIDNNSGPFNLVDGDIVNFIDYITFDISSNKYFKINAPNSTILIDGKGYQATLINSNNSLILNDQDNCDVTIQFLGVLQGSNYNIGNQQSGLYVSRSNGSTIKINYCYYSGNIKGQDAGGLYGSNYDGGITTYLNNIYITNSYVIGNVNTDGDTEAGAGGFIGSSPTDKTTYCLLENCYFIGSVNTSRFAGAFIGAGNGEISARGSNIWFFNCYSSNSQIIGQLVSGDNTEVGYKNLYTYSTWSDSDANNNLELSTITNISTITGSSGWTMLSGTYNSTTLSTVLTNAGVTSRINESGELTYKSSGGINQPYILTRLTINPPYDSTKYTSATSLAANCLCKGTKITLKNGKKINIEDIIPGDEVMTPYGVSKRVLHVGKMWYQKQSRKHDPCKIPKDFFNEGLPSEDTYVSGEHNFLFSSAEADLLGLKLGKYKEKGKGLLLYLTRTFAEKQEYQKVCHLKGESRSQYGFYYYHLVIEDDLGFIANNLPSESITLNEFKKNFEEINKNINEENI